MQSPISSERDHDHDHHGPNPLGQCNIQGDPILLLPKKQENFIFFNIIDLAEFRAALLKLSDKITCARRTMTVRETLKQLKNNQPKGTQDKPLLPLKLLNIAFSKDGLRELGLKPEELMDDEFSRGQLDDAESLGDSGKNISGRFVPDWDPVFKSRIDGVILVATESDQTMIELTRELNDILGTAVEKVYVLRGSVRTAEGQEKNEHFGWRDGISQPFLRGLSPNQPNKGQREVDPGVVILGAVGDSLKDKRPDWGLDGSFLVFRKLHQLVPEFHEFIKTNPVVIKGIPVDGGSALRCAQFFGRWKSGAPVEVFPTSDPGVEIGGNSEINNDFVFQPGNQQHCPYSAHIRKMNPRDPTGMPLNHLEHTSIVRAGIPYGPDPKDGEDPKTERGLAFVCYQSSIANGFKTQQKFWANNQHFPVEAATAGVIPGFDPIIGQDNGAPRTTTDTQGNPLSGVPEFVQPRGGGYFFSPSIWALRHRLSGSK